MFKIGDLVFVDGRYGHVVDVLRDGMAIRVKERDSEYVYMTTLWDIKIVDNKFLSDRSDWLLDQLDLIGDYMAEIIVQSIGVDNQCH